MKSFMFALIALCSVMMLSNCQKVIDIDLNDTDQRVVIEGTILRGDTVHRVRITKTQNFDDGTPPPVVDNAVLTVIDNYGNEGIFVPVGNGWYELTAYPGFENRTYTLTAVVEGKTYVASSTMPNFQPIDSLYVVAYNFGDDSLITIVPQHYDLQGVSNYYQFHVYRNGIRDKGIYLQTDQFTDGSIMLQPIFLSELEVGDEVRVDMFTIDKPIYTYFNQLSVNSSSSATPANPVSNFSGGCMGYFSARCVDSRTIIVGQ